MLRVKFHFISYSAHFLKGEEHPIGAFNGAELVLFRSPPSVIPSAQKISKGNGKESVLVLQDTHG
jgi:hypothetical protein